MACAALGGSVDIPGIDGHKIEVKVAAGTQSGQRLKIKGEGMTKIRSVDKGDLWVVFKVETPVNLSPRQKELLEEYLENRAQAKKQQLEMLNKKIAKMELERSRQTQSWNSERQMAKASNAYDANIMMEAELVKNITKGENNGKDKVQEYYEKLCKKFPEITFNTGSSLMSGNENKVVINLSSECLKKMANDPEFAKKVEFNLTGAVPGQNRMFAQAKADNAVIHGVTTVIDADGNASVTCGGMTRTSASKQNSTTLNPEKKQKERLEQMGVVNQLY